MKKNSKLYYIISGEASGDLHGSHLIKSIKKTPLIIILDDIRSLNNIGSIFRTCDAFKIEKIYLCGITATPPNRKITKTAIGAT